MLIVEHSYTSMTLLFLSNMVTLLHNFGEATGLKTNLSKSSITLIRCDDIDIPSIMDDFPATIAPFPIKYLGLSLSLGRLRRTDLQPFIDMAVEGEISKAGCAELVRSVVRAHCFAHIPANCSKGGYGYVKGLQHDLSGNIVGLLR
jgi:hypothetical protein